MRLRDDLPPKQRARFSPVVPEADVVLREDQIPDDLREFFEPVEPALLSTWKIATKGFKGAHFAVMPEALAEVCVLAGSRPGDIVFDPFCGAGTTGVVALKHGRDFIGAEGNLEYVKMAKKRIRESIR